MAGELITELKALLHTFEGELVVEPEIKLTVRMYEDFLAPVVGNKVSLETSLFDLIAPAPSDSRSDEDSELEPIAG